VCGGWASDRDGADGWVSGERTVERHATFTSRQCQHSGRREHCTGAQRDRPRSPPAECHPVDDAEFSGHSATCGLLCSRWFRGPWAERRRSHRNERRTPARVHRLSTAAASRSSVIAMSWNHEHGEGPGQTGRIGRIGRRDQRSRSDSGAASGGGGRLPIICDSGPTAGRDGHRDARWLAVPAADSGTATSRRTGTGGWRQCSAAQGQQ